MEITDLLLVSIEISVAFAGFAGIIATFQYRGEKQAKKGDVIGISMIVHLSLGCAVELHSNLVRHEAPIY